MPLSEADQIRELLTRLMGEVRANPTLTAEVARAEREFFHANPRALEQDRAARFRFQEWYLLERESEVLGEVPVACLPMREAERESLSDSLAGVFQVTGANPAEYAIQDLQDDRVHDLLPIEGYVLEVGDVLIGRLYEGSLDTFVASSALGCQRDAIPLATAFGQDVARMQLERRLTQAELERLMFRGRGDEQPTSPAAPEEIPLERLEADLEACMGEGDVATAISNALATAVRPGLIMRPLLEKIAFDTSVDIEAAQRCMLRIWEHHQQRLDTAPELDAMEAELDVAESVAPEPEHNHVVEDARGTDAQPGLGAEIARRLQSGLEGTGDVAEVFADVERMVGDPDTEDESVPTESNAAGYEGDLRPLIREYLWETGRDGEADVDVLEQLVLTRHEASVPRLDLESIGSLDLSRLLLQTYLQSSPGRRSGAVGHVFRSLERFYKWAQETQCYDLASILEEVRSTLVEHVPRLDAASMALSRGDATKGLDTSPAGRGLARVVRVSPNSIEVAVEDSGDLVRVAVDADGGENLRVDDLLLGSLEPGSGADGSFAGMVVAMPTIAAGLFG